MATYLILAKGHGSNSRGILGSFVVGPSFPVCKHMYMYTCKHRDSLLSDIIDMIVR